MTSRKRPRKKKGSQNFEESQTPSVEERKKQYQKVIQDVMHSHPLPHHLVGMTPAIDKSDLGQIEFEFVVTDFDNPVSAEEIRQYDRTQLEKFLSAAGRNDILIGNHIERLVDEGIRGQLSKTFVLINNLGVASILLTGMFVADQPFKKAHVGISAAVINHLLSTYLLLKSGLYVDALICVRSAFENYWLLQYVGIDDQRADQWLSGKIISPSKVRKSLPESDLLTEIYSELSEAAHLTSSSTNLYGKSIGDRGGFFLGAAEPNENAVYVFMYLGVCILGMFDLISEWIEVHMGDYENDDLIVEFMNGCLEKSTELIVEATLAVEEFELTP